MNIKIKEEARCAWLLTKWAGERLFAAAAVTAVLYVLIINAGMR
jgi:hypothetical protein